MLILGEDEVLQAENMPKNKTSLNDIAFEEFGTLKQFKEAGKVLDRKA